MGKIDVKHLYCCLPMAIWYSFLLVGHYRIFRSMNTLTNYHSLDPKDEMELLMTSEIGSLKGRVITNKSYTVWHKKTISLG